LQKAEFHPDVVPACHHSNMPLSCQKEGLLQITTDYPTFTDHHTILFFSLIEKARIAVGTVVLSRPVPRVFWVIYNFLVLINVSNSF